MTSPYCYAAVSAIFKFPRKTRLKIWHVLQPIFQYFSYLMYFSWYKAIPHNKVSKWICVFGMILHKYMKYCAFLTILYTYNSLAWNNVQCTDDGYYKLHYGVCSLRQFRTGFVDVTRGLVIRTCNGVPVSSQWGLGQSPSHAFAFMYSRLAQHYVCNLLQLVNGFVDVSQRIDH